MSEYHIAQINIARMLASIDDPIITEFVAQLPPINALADGSLALSGGSNLRAEMQPYMSL